MFYALVRSVGWLLLRVAFRWKVEGAGRVPATGPVILCPNHVFWMDPVTVACSIRRRVYYMAKDELFHNPLKRVFLRAVGAFPVRRHEVDRAAVKAALRVLKQGRVLGLFPEGTRSRTGVLQKGEEGASLLALRTGAPVIPVGIVGDYSRWSRLLVRFGEPLTFTGEAGVKPTSDRMAAISQRIMAAVAELLPEGQVKLPPGEDAG
jgi:1-acyl-sn-glycerol-3-phosphate acyltransferase